jgi:uncharacterized membrane protein YhaH (DUF805 family)
MSTESYQPKQKDGKAMELIFYIIFAAIFVVPLWKICVRAGFNGALSLLALIPWLGLVIVGGVLSFSEWAPKKQ